MTDARHWQAHVTYAWRGETRQLTFGVQAGSLPAALLNAYRQAAEIPGVASHIALTCLHEQHHPLRHGAAA